MLANSGISPNYVPFYPYATPGDHRNNFKMAAKLSVEEVLNKVLEGNADTNQEQIRSENDDENSNVLTLPEISEPGIPRMLFSLNINAGKVFRGESYLWLKAIHRRLAGRRNIRRPFFSQIRRDIPEEMFRCLVRAIKSCRRPLFCDPNCYVVESKKMTVVSFQSILAVKEFLSALSMTEVSGYLERRLRGNRKDHLTKLLVSETKDFALIYHSNKGQFVLSFHFGEWNAFGFPQHNCQL